MNPFVSRFGRNSWIIALSAMSLTLGLMLSMAWLTAETRESRFGQLPSDLRTRITASTLDFETEFIKTQQELKTVRDSLAELREENTKLQNAVADQTKSTKVLNEALQEQKAYAGLTEVEGPGIMITLKDSEKEAPAGFSASEVAIHDIDVLKVVNELWNAGAEAVSVNNLRIGPRTNFRCVGSVILVDRVQIASPVVIRAIGDAKTLVGAMNLPLSVLAELRQFDPAMATVQEVDRMRLPAFSGSTKSTSMRVVEPKS